MRAAAVLVVLPPLLLLLGAAASADPGIPARTVGRATELPPRRDTREVLLLVGGLGSSPGDGAFDALIERYRDDPRIEVVRFGADPRQPYDTSGAIGPNAASLRDAVRSLSGGSRAVHLVTHSMGGAVTDAAFAQGLGAADGVRTYIALAAPHRGSEAARIAATTLTLAGDEALEVRAAAAALAHDPGGPAARDLARRPAAVTTPGVTRLDLRLATDVIVLGADSAGGAADSRLLLPTTRGSLEGHGGILRDPAVLDAITATVASGRPPLDERGVVLRAATGLAGRAADELTRLALLALAAAALIAAAVLRAARLPRLLTRPLAERALAGR